MPREQAAHLHIVDSATGEIVEHCPLCGEKDREIARWRKITADLRRDRAQEARDHQLWPQAVTLFAEYKIATGRAKVKWGADRFWLCQPYLANDGFPLCRWSVWGIAYEPNTRTLPSGLVETYNDWELLFRNRGTFERYARRGWANPEAREQFADREAGTMPDELKKLG